MTTGRKTTTVFLTVLSGLLLTILGLTQRWPAWAWPPLAVLLVAIPALTFKAASRRRGSMPVSFEEQLTTAPVQRNEHCVRQVALPSQWADYDFVFSATVRWYLLSPSGGDPVLNPAGLAVEAVLDRARAITEKREPSRASLVQHELSGALSIMLPDLTSHLQAMADNVTITLLQPDQERLDKLADVRKDKAVWEHQRKYEQSKRQYLGEDVLKDTGSAVVWWLAKHDEHVEKAVTDLGLLAQLTSAANDSDIPERLQHLLAQPPGQVDPLPRVISPPTEPERQPADHIADFFDSMGFTQGDVRRSFLAKQFADIIRAQDRHEAADNVLHRFDQPAAFAADDPERTHGSNDEPDHGSES
ncbi:hypothetical protein AB0M29_31100 [Streptomyces sp. NPDC051976]|uniref:hypothetical protein n=1 Tax=Streptomyces sp. NPDC051976 TaxID=3154947 RepID=UPI00342C7694